MNTDSYNATEDANVTNAEIPSFLDYIMNKSCSSSIFLCDCDSGLARLVTFPLNLSRDLAK